MPPHLHADLLEVPEHGHVVLGQVPDAPQVSPGDDEEVDVARGPDVVERHVLLVAEEVLCFGLCS